jgi:hypothetical protein
LSNVPKQLISSSSGETINRKIIFSFSVHFIISAEMYSLLASHNNKTGLSVDLCGMVNLE